MDTSKFLKMYMKIIFQLYEFDVWREIHDKNLFNLLDILSALYLFINIMIRI